MERRREGQLTKTESAAARAVMEAWENGKEIQHKARIFGAWCTPDPEAITWNWNEFEYRIKPEPPKPRVVECWVYESIYQICVRETKYFRTQTDDQLEEAGWRKALFREVLNEEPEQESER